LRQTKGVTIFFVVDIGLGANTIWA